MAFFLLLRGPRAFLLALADKRLFKSPWFDELKAIVHSGWFGNFPWKKFKILLQVTSEAGKHPRWPWNRRRWALTLPLTHLEGCIFSDFFFKNSSLIIVQMPSYVPGQLIETYCELLRLKALGCIFLFMTSFVSSINCFQLKRRIKL
jgi:hypothetical protein